jgi:galactokinase
MFSKECEESFLLNKASALTFEKEFPIHFSRAPARLDVMGGIADYSQSRVLQLTLAAQVTVYAQKKKKSKRFGTGYFEIISDLNTEENHNQLVQRRRIKIPMHEFLDPRSSKLFKYGILADKLCAFDRWSAYILGPILTFALEHNARLTDRDNFIMYVYSTIPEGKGVSSSAALEIASCASFFSLLGFSRKEFEKWRLIPFYAFAAENLLVRAPCGIMDQMACFYGRKNYLTPLTCSLPPLMGRCIEVPKFALCIYGIDSTIKHKNTEGKYGRVRAAAFMGKTIIEQEKLVNFNFKSLCSLNRKFCNSEELHSFLENLLPEMMKGKDFLEIYGNDHGDLLTAPIKEEVFYPVRPSTMHALHEDVRVREFEQILIKGKVTELEAKKLGRLMLDSHLSYSRCSMGSKATDLLVELLSDIAYGSRISGGGCGGLVVSLIQNTPEASSAFMNSLTEFAQQLQISAGDVHFLSGSSGGTCDSTTQIIY